MLYIPNSTKDFLKKQIFASIGIPSDMIKERYKLDNKCNFSLQQYVLQTYILFDGLRAKCNSICDYLYSIYPNCEENIKENFQIQRMDGRNIKVERIDEEHIALVPSITGEAEKLVNEHDEQDAYKHELTALLNRCHISNEEKPDYEYINTTIDYILKLSNERLDIKIEFEQILITLICIVLKNESTSNDRREYLCDIWLIKLEGIFDSNHPIVEVAIVKILLEQVYSPVSNDIKNRIKCFIFKCIRYNENDGIVDKYAKVVVQFLNTDNKLAHTFFSTILMLSKKTKKLKDEDIIEQYLLNEMKPKEYHFVYDDFDFSSLITITNCGLDLDDECFCNVIIMLLQMLDAELGKKESAFRVFDTHKVVRFMQRQVQNIALSHKAIDIIFENINFENATERTMDLYNDIFSYNLSAYFDGHSNIQIRTNIQNTLEYLEEKIKCI